MEVMEKKKTSRLKIIAAVLLVLTIAITGIAILQIRKADKDVMFLGGYYGLRLFHDGSFGFGNLSSSLMVIVDPTAPNLYRWEGDTLILEFGDSVGVLYFQKEGDTLVFQREPSVFPKDPRYEIGSLSDGTILKKVEQ